MYSYTDTFRCIAVDMGASSIRIMLGMMGPNGMNYEEVRRMTNGTIFQEGHERWDIDMIFKGITTGIKEAVISSDGTISSIGIDSWGVDFALLDGAGKLLELPVSYRDSRTDGMQEQWEKSMSAIETFNRTGINFYIFNTLYQLLSMRGDELLKKASSLLFMPSFISYLLTGKAFNELTIASTSQMLMVDGKRWDPEILRQLRIPEKMLAPVISPGTRLGRVALGNDAGTSMEGVAVCGHDTASVVAAIPVIHSEYVFISAGTWCIVGVESETPLLHEEVFRRGFTNERGYDHRYRILKNIVGLWLLQGLKKHYSKVSSFDEMEQMARDSGRGDLLIDPDDQGFFNPDDMKRAFDTYFRKTGQERPEYAGDYVDCAYRSLSYSFRYHIEILEKLSGRRFSVIHVVGGGSQSDYLNQLISDICNKPVISGPVEAATIGNMLVQAITMGKIADLDQGRTFVREHTPLKEYKPRPDPQKIIHQYQKFLSIKNH